MNIAVVSARTGITAAIGGRLPAGPGCARACSRRWSAKSPSPSSRPQGRRGRRALDDEEELGFCAAHRLPLPTQRPTPPPPGKIRQRSRRKTLDEEGLLCSRLFTRPTSQQSPPEAQPSTVQSPFHSTPQATSIGPQLPQLSTAAASRPSSPAAAAPPARDTSPEECPAAESVRPRSPASPPLLAPSSSPPAPQAVQKRSPFPTLPPPTPTLKPLAKVC